MKIKSKIDATKQVEYTESRELSPDDVWVETALYETDILDKPVAICLGRANYTYNSVSYTHLTLPTID
jgi:hypothetical protein